MTEMIGHNLPISAGELKIEFDSLSKVFRGDEEAAESNRLFVWWTANFENSRSKWPFPKGGSAVRIRSYIYYKHKKSNGW